MVSFEEKGLGVQHELTVRGQGPCPVLTDGPLSGGESTSERIARLNYLAVNIRHTRIPPTDLRREVVAAIRELQDFIRDEEDGWRDIATAPIMEAVLVYGGEVKYPVVASWTGLNDEPWTLDALGNVHDEIDWPTHWMPLPAPPAENSLSGPQGTEAALSVHDEQS